jgi:hypothetical protein
MRRPIIAWDALVAIAVLALVAIHACSANSAEPKREVPRVELVLVFCPASVAPERWSKEICQEERPELEPIPETQCLIEAQRLAVAWLDDHPKWMFGGWRCESPGKPKERAL